MLQIQSPFQQLFDTNGSPLDDGYVYIGTANANPETSPIAIYWDDAGTIPAAQPLRTLNGYIVRSGTPARVYTALDDFSMTVKDRQGRVVFSVLDATSDSNLTTALASSSGSSLVGFLQAGAGAQARTVQSKLRDVVSVKDFGAVGDGITDDTAAFQAALATSKNVFAPKGTYKVTSSLSLISGQTFSGEQGTVIAGDVPDYVFKMLGSTGAAISSVTAAISKLTWTITMASPVGLAEGDDILMYDVVSDVFEVNRIQRIISNTLYCTWPITQAFATPANIRLYKLTPITNANIRDIEISNVGALGGAISYTYSRDCEVTGVRLRNLAYIGCTFQNSTGCVFHRNIAERVGASVIGLRVTKACRITENRITDTQSDEAITLFKSNSHAVIEGNQVAQYLFGSGPAGGGGNTILLDQDNYYNTIIGNTLEGSATYHIYLFSASSHNTVVGNTCNRANLGAIKVQLGSNGNTIDNNICMHVVDATDANEGGAATAAIRIKSDCSGNIIGPGNVFANLSGVAVVDSQASSGVSYASRLGVNTTNPYHRADTRGGSSGVTTTDFVAGSAGTSAGLSLGAATGNTFAQLNVGTVGDNTVGHLALMRFGGTAAVGRTSTQSGGKFEVDGNIVANLPSAAPTLGVNGDMSFQLVSNTQLRILVRGADGVTRTNTLTLT